MGADTVCTDVLELNCQVAAWTECKAESTSHKGTKCFVEYKDFPFKDCKEVKDNKKHIKKVPDCKNVTKNNCVNCKEKLVNKCATASWQECKMEPVEECE